MDHYEKHEHYYKAVDENFCGRNNFQYEVDKEYTVEGVDDNGNPNPAAEEDWCNFSPYISLCIRHFTHPRVCEIEVLSPDEMSEDCYYDLRLKEWLPFYTAHRVKILRELSQEEICDQLEEENASVYMFLNMDAPFEYLLGRKKEIRGESLAMYVLEKEYLTDDQKKVTDQYSVVRLR